jgi:hypothetical protein
MACGRYVCLPASVYAFNEIIQLFHITLSHPLLFLSLHFEIQARLTDDCLLCRLCFSIGHHELTLSPTNCGEGEVICWSLDVEKRYSVPMVLSTTL